MSDDFPVAIASGRVQFLGAVIERMNEIGWKDFQFKPLENAVIKALSGKKPAWTEYKWVTMLERMTQGGKHLLFPESSKLIQAWVVHCPQAAQRIEDFANAHNRQGLWSSVAREFVYQPHPKSREFFDAIGTQQKEIMAQYLAETLVDVDHTIRFFHEEDTDPKISPEFAQCVPQYKDQAKQMLKKVLAGQGEIQKFSSLMGVLFNGGMGLSFDVDPAFKSQLDNIFEQEQRQSMGRADRILKEHMDMLELQDIMDLMKVARNTPYHDELKQSWPLMSARVEHHDIHQALDEGGMESAGRAKKKI